MKKISLVVMAMLVALLISATGCGKSVSTREKGGSAPAVTYVQQAPSEVPGKVDSPSGKLTSESAMSTGTSESVDSPSGDDKPQVQSVVFFNYERGYVDSVSGKED